MSIGIRGHGIAGTSAAGVLTVQGIAGGVAVPISGGGGGGATQVEGMAAEGAALSGNPVRMGGSDGANIRTPRVFDLDSGGGTEYSLGVSLRLAGAGGSVAFGTSANPVRTDPTGTTPQPINYNPRTTSQYSQAVISSAAGGDISLVAAVALQTVRMFAILLKVAGLTDLTFKSGAATARSGALPFQPFDSLVMDPNGDPWYTTAAGEALVLNSSAAIQVSGTVWYTQS